MKLDGIAVAGPWTGRRLRRESSELAINTLTRHLRKFFDGEADGHGSLKRKPPQALQTPQYFKTLNVISCYPVPKVHWMAFVNATNYKKQFSAADNLVKIQRPQAILTAKPSVAK